LASGLFQPPAELDPKERQLLQLQDEVWSEESERFLDLLDLKTGDRVVAYGAGPGLDLPRLARRVTLSGEVVAVEHNPLLAEEARALVKKLRLPQVSVVLGDLVVEPIPPGPYQAVFCSWTQGSVLAGPSTFQELQHMLTTLRPILGAGARLGFWEYQRNGLQVTPGNGTVASLSSLFVELLAKPQNISQSERLPSAFLGHHILLKKAWPAQQAGLPGSRLHQFVELWLRFHMPGLTAANLLNEEQEQTFWRDWEQSKVDPQTLVFSPRTLGIVGQTMDTLLEVRSRL
jgi:hypothetical protein